MKRLVVGISGASGVPIAVELLRSLADIETHLVITKGGEMTLSQESSLSLDDLFSLASVVHDNADIGASIASGSFETIGMVVVPCSMKTVAGIVTGYTDNLLLRAADVVLKERRKLVLVTRECPFGTIHLRNMYELSQMGAVILPPVVSYYNHPKTAEDITRQLAGKIADQFSLKCEHFRRWEGMK